MQHVSPTELQKPLHPLLPEYLSAACGRGVALKREEKGSEICVFVRV